MTLLCAPALTADLWISRPVPLADPRMRLFCLPHAGSGVAQFRPWAELLPPGVELCPVRLPGRESRSLEAPLTHLPSIVDGLAAAIAPFLDRPFAVFGHSMGALLGFELARQLARQGASQPAQLFVSGRSAPHLPEREADMHRLPDGQFVAELARRYGPASVTLLADPELRDKFLPLLRADLRAVETYAYIASQPLGCAITAFGGVDDPRADQAQLDGWRAHTRAAFAVYRFPGDHFFHQAARRPMLAQIRAALEV